MKLTDPIFSNVDKARAHFEAIRWPNGPVCPHCGEGEKVYRLDGKKHRPGLIHCNACSGQFTVTTGGVMESSHIPLNKWALGFYLYAASKKGFSAHQLHRQLGISYKSAWFMAHRIREAMAPAKGEIEPMGGHGKIVEADETELAPSRKTRKAKARANNPKVLSLVQRDGKTRSFRIDSTNVKDIKPVIDANVHKGTRLMTDTASHYSKGKMGIASHEMVNHSHDEYARDDVTTNTVEGYFSIFKRGLVGTYQHMSSQHLDRYLAEFDFRMSNRAALGVNDDVRAERAIHGAEPSRSQAGRRGIIWPRTGDEQSPRILHDSLCRVLPLYAVPCRIAFPADF